LLHSVLINYCSYMFRPLFLAIFKKHLEKTYVLPEDDQELRPKHVGAIIKMDIVQQVVIGHYI